jgi:integration host factor beta subunit
MIRKLAEATGSTKTEAAKTLDVVITNITETLARGESISIPGFGTFTTTVREPRIGRNPKTGKTVNINERYVPHFKPGKNLKKRVNQGTG